MRSVLVKEKVRVIQSLESASVHWVGLDSSVKGNVKQVTTASTASIRAIAGTMPHATKELVAVNAILDGMGSCAIKHVQKVFMAPTVWKFASAEMVPSAFLPVVNVSAEPASLDTDANQSVSLDVSESTVPRHVIVQLVFHVMSSQEPVNVLPVGKEPPAKGVAMKDSLVQTVSSYVTVRTKPSVTPSQGSANVQGVGWDHFVRQSKLKNRVNEGEVVYATNKVVTRWKILS